MKIVTTILEVAKRVRTSRVTVSRMLSGDGCVGREIKDRMFQAVEESDYRPNLLARNLLAKNTQTLGLVVTNTFYRGIYFSELLSHAVRMAGEERWQLLLVDGKHNAEEEYQVVQYLLDLRCNAIMIYPRSLSVDEADDIIDVHSQLIMVPDRRLRKSSNHSVWCDHKQANFNAAAELISTGYQEITFLTGSMDPPASIEHLAGYKDALVQYGIALNKKLIANGKWTPPSGAEGVEMLLERGAKFNTLVASNDDMVIGAMEALHKRGAVVPEQVSVIGLDDITIAPYTVPMLSSIRIPVTEMIQETTGRPIFMLDGGDFSLPRTFSGKLIRRGSFVAPSR